MFPLLFHFLEILLFKKWETINVFLVLFLVPSVVLRKYSKLNPGLRMNEEMKGHSLISLMQHLIRVSTSQKP